MFVFSFSLMTIFSSLEGVGKSCWSWDFRVDFFFLHNLLLTINRFWLPGWGCSSEVERLCSMPKAQDSIPGVGEKKKVTNCIYLAMKINCVFLPNSRKQPLLTVLATGYLDSMQSLWNSLIMSLGYRLALLVLFFFPLSWPSFSAAFWGNIDLRQ